MRTLFTRLAILPKGEEEDSNNTMDELINYCWNWVEKAYPSIDINKNKIGYQKLKANSSIIIENKSLDGVRFWKMVRSEEGGKDIGTEFKNYIFIAKDGDWIEFSLLQSVVHPVNRITPHEIPIYPPWLLNKIIDSFDCRVGEDIISSDWTTIVPENIEYLRKKIINSDRRVPIIVLSKKWATRKSIIQKPGILSNKLSSLAEIYILSDPNTKQLGKPFGQQWLSNGTIRIFWPGVTSELLSFDPAWNNMYSQKRLDGEFNGNEGELIQDIINKVCLATMSQQASSDFVKNIREKIERNELELELEKNNSERELILTEISSSTEKISYLENELKILNDKVSINDIEFNKTNIKLEERNEKIDSLMHQINTLNDENKSNMMDIDFEMPTLVGNDGGDHGDATKFSRQRKAKRDRNISLDLLGLQFEPTAQKALLSTSPFGGATVLLQSPQNSGASMLTKNLGDLMRHRTSTANSITTFVEEDIDVTMVETPRAVAPSYGSIPDFGFAFEV